MTRVNINKSTLNLQIYIGIKAFSGYMKNISKRMKLFRNSNKYFMFDLQISLILVLENTLDPYMSKYFHNITNQHRLAISNNKQSSVVSRLLTQTIEYVKYLSH